MCFSRRNAGSQAARQPGSQAARQPDSQPASHCGQPASPTAMQPVSTYYEPTRARSARRTGGGIAVDDHGSDAD
eukprot:10022434-Heterocapsa_arctica.AAC.1